MCIRDSDYTINKGLYDDKTGALQEMQNNVQIGDYDVRIVGNSTMPSNKWAEWQIYMEAFQMGLIDRQEALAKTEVFDKEGVLQRMDVIEQLQQQLQSQEKTIKDLSGDLQTARREAVSARQRTEVEKYKADLDNIKTQNKADARVAVSKLESALNVEKSKGQTQNKEKS